jgi:methionyl-tRNA formyltransferase
MRLIFMGTPEAAVPTLRRCLADGHEIAAVWTQPDKPAGRGNKLKSPPVKEFALAHHLNIHQPAKVRTPEAFELFASHKADAAVVVAYGRILPAALLHAPPLGCINVHFSLLPKYRGAAPVNWAIVRGEKETGVTTMCMDEGLDTGAILLQRATAIAEKETAPELMARLAHLGADLLSETLKRFSELKPRAQQEEAAIHAPMLRREDGLIDWSQDAFTIERCVRGFQPWPIAHTTFDGRRILVWSATSVAANTVALRSDALYMMDILAGRSLKTGNVIEVGEIVEARKGWLTVACGSKTLLQLLEVQPEGKRRMSVRDFLNGVQLKTGDRFG